MSYNFIFRVTKPPGGASSIVFGGGQSEVQPSAKANPSFHSTVFSSDQPKSVLGSSKSSKMLQTSHCLG